MWFKTYAYLNDLQLVDLDFGTPGQVEILLGNDVLPDILLNDRRRGPPGLPSALKTLFGWVLCEC